MTITLKKFWCYILICTTFLLQSCATHQIQLHKNNNKNQIIEVIDSSKIEHTFFMIGDAGNANQEKTKQTLQALENKLNAAKANATLLFLGDNIYPVGMPADKNDPNYTLAETKITNQLRLAKNFKGKTIFIPGNHDWYSGLKGLENQAKTVTQFTNDKKSFLPRYGCAIEELKINKKTILITIDSEWFLQDWDRFPGINDDCNIKTREVFFEELESILNKNQDKIKIIALHHPLMSNGSHGGQYSWEKQIFPLENKIPLPIIGSFVNLIRKTSGISPQDLQNKQYQILSKRIIALLQGHQNVIVVSGHDHNLQYIEKDNISQIISGAGSKSEAAKAIGQNDFSYGGNGFVTLDILKNGEINIGYHGMENSQEKLLWQHTINKMKPEPKQTFPSTFPNITNASIYTKKMTTKSWFHNWFLGSHYKDLYSTSIATKTATLDTLYGGLKPTQAGGGHQSRSLRLKDANGREFVMRALKKSASRFLQSVAFKHQYVEKQFENTYAEKFLLDFYTTSHPYTPFIVGNIADKIGVSHTNPELYYIPKHTDLKDFNNDFGDELYMVEERPTDSQIDLPSFGKPDAIIDTDEVLANLRKDEKYSIDEQAYIKARLFDMLIGDWDRHFDQWRWGEYKVGDKVIYK
ncbi:MAG: metallophosphoesterase, partial [Flavobacterium sp.]